MSGARQFAVLLRKNLLLKTRRPYATCCELSTPIVLFILLAYVRSIYEIKVYGPFFFEQGPIFPMTGLLLGQDGKSQALLDFQTSRAKCKENCNWDWNATEDHVIPTAFLNDVKSPTGDSYQMPGWLKTIEQNVMCNENLALSMAGVLDPILRLRAGPHSLGEMLVTMDPAEAEQWMNSTVSRLQNEDPKEVVQELTRLRDGYLASRWRQRVEDIAARMDQELLTLQAQIDAYAATGDAARRSAEGLVDDICSLRLWNRTMGSGWSWPPAGWNGTVDAAAAASVLSEMGKALLRRDVSAQNASDSLRAMARAIEAWNLTRDGLPMVSVPGMPTLPAVNVSQLEAEINRLRKGLALALPSASALPPTSSDLAKAVSEIADALQQMSGGGDFLSSWDSTAVAEDLKALADYMQRSNWSAWLRDENASQMLEPVLDWLGSLLGNSTEMDIEGMSQKVSHFFQGLPVDTVAEVADQATWWLSHFVRSRSMLARLMGELPGDEFWKADDGAYMWDKADDVRNKAMIPTSEEFRTSLGGAVYSVLDRLQSQARNMSGLRGAAWGGPPDEQAWGHELGRLRDASDIGSLPPLPPWSAVQDAARRWNGTQPQHDAGLWLQRLADLSDRLRNRTVQQISMEMLPQWAALWTGGCPQVLNRSRIGDLFARTAQGCPFYKRAVKQLQDMRALALERVQAAHRWLEETDFSKVEEYATSAQRMLQQVPTDSASDMAGRVTREVQQRTNRTTRYKGRGCLRMASTSCSALRTKEDCLAHRDGSLRSKRNRLHTRGEPCVWCGGGPCTSDSDSVCEPKEWLLEGEGTAYTTFLAKTNYTVAKKNCGVAGALGIALQREYWSQRDLDCSRSQARKAAAQSHPSGSTSSVSNYIQTYLTTRKILIAPYKGEVKQLFDLALVEFAMGAMKDPQGGLLGSLFRCPLVQAAAAGGIKLFLEDRLVYMDSGEEVESFARQQPDAVLLALVFKNADADGNFGPGEVKVQYEIRISADLAPDTSKILRQDQNAIFGGSRISSYPYLALYFPQLMDMFGRATARLQTLRVVDGPGRAGGPASDVGGPVDAGGRGPATSSEVHRNIMATKLTEPGRAIDVGVEQYPVNRYGVDGYIRVIQQTLPMLMILGWIYAVSLLVREIVYEKQERLRDIMRIMGLKTWVYWASWMASAMAQLTGLVLLMTIIMSAGKVLKHSDPTVIFVFFWLYSLSTVSLSLLISSFFSRAKVAAACGGLGYYVMYMPYMLYNRFDETMGTSSKNLLCLLSSTGMGVGMAIVAKWELLEVGVQWNNIFTTPPITYTGNVPKDRHSLGHVWVMLFIDTVLYQVLAWYVEKVFPGTLGLPQPFYFPLLPSFWFPQPAAAEELRLDGVNAEQEDNSVLECWEAPADGLEVTVQIRHLAKTFRNGKKALSGISLDMHRGTIMGLLGHNGAGKSTTMSILTGLYPPTKGDVRVNGVSVCKDSEGVRRQLGVCLQHNALYENVTVEEHLRLFCCLKAVPWDAMQGEIEGLLRDTGLVAKRHAPTRALSGGMKRKLSIGIALAGGSSVVTLDEPTAGVDATSRRDIWQLLNTHKVSRTILLSTHFMDEADILSDRIAIIAEGKLTAIGSSLALKRKFADGYMLTVVTTDAAQLAKLTLAVKSAVPEASYVGARGREITYVLPFESRGRFPGLFSQMQDDKVRATLGIDAYGLSAATMEEVFLRASSMHEAGLHGLVRNGGASAAAGEAQEPEDASTAEGSSNADTNSDKGGDSPTKRPSSHSLDTPSSQGEKDNSAGIEAATAADAAIPDERPQSPQCMGGGMTPRAPEASAVQAQHRNHNADPDGRSQSRAAAGPKPLYGVLLWVQQFDALFRKRMLSVRRDRRAWASQLLLPALFVLIALVVAKILAIQDQMPALKLSTEMLQGTIAGRSTTVQVKKNVIPISGTDHDALGADIRAAFAAAGNAGDEFQPFSEANTTLAEHLMYNIRQLGSSYAGVTLRDGEAQPNVTLWFQNQAVHIIPAMASMWNDARLRLLGFKEAKVEVWSHPLPKTQQLLQAEMTGSNQVFTDLTVAITIILAMGFIPASFVVYLVHEKSTSGKHQQLLSGISPLMYWLNNYIWDMVNFLLPLAICFLLFIAFQVGSYSGANGPAVFFLLLFYGACMTPLMYCLEPVFTVSSTAYVTLIVGNIFTGTLSVLATTVMDLYEDEVTTLQPLNKVCKVIFPWILPNYCLGRGLIDIAVNYYLNFAAQAFGVCVHPGGKCIVNPLSWDVAGRFIGSLIIMAPVWLGLRLLIEWGFCTRGLRQRAALLLADRTNHALRSEDEAVRTEAERVESALAAARASGAVAADQLVISDLGKSFMKRRLGVGAGKTVHAVRGISVGVPAGECFGLLGVNGAGKTTTMRMITGDTEITRGDILVGGWSVHSKRDKARQHLGYCPQFDALPDKLTVRECLALYARIRGIPPFQVWETVGTMITRMCLEAHQYNLCENLSGGNKRKLSTALALIGEPDVVLLDEPSTGVDVGARRFLWEVISDVRRSGHAVVLTSHSMEECEVLCTRLTIMVHGQMRCLGSPTELKAKYGGGYTLTVKARLQRDGPEAQSGAAAAAPDPCAQIRSFVARQVPIATLSEESVGLLRYRMGGQGCTQEVPLAEIFQSFEEATRERGALSGCVSDYSLSQTSLEEVFLYFSQVGEREYAAETGAEVELPTAGKEVEGVVVAINNSKGAEAALDGNKQGADGKEDNEVEVRSRDEITI